MTRFYVPCPTCKLPIRGRSSGESLDTHRIEFDADSFKGDREPSLVVTVDPNVPCRYEATAMGGFGTAPTMTLVHLAGDDQAETLFMYLGRGRSSAEKLWPRVRQMYEYYLEGDWDRFDKGGRAVFEDKWRTVTTAHERATAVYQAVGIALRLILDDEHPASAIFLRRYLRKHTRALESQTYVSFARAEASSGSLPTLQRQVFDVIDLFVRRFDSWQMGLLRRVMPEERLHLLDDLRLFRDEFDILRDLYQQGFETVCKTLRYPVAAQNTVKRNRPDDFGLDVPPTLQRKTNPPSLKVYERLSNFEKLQYVAQVPGWEAWTKLLDNKTRNAIGHATARHDLRTGLVTSDVAPQGVPYLDVAADVYGLFDALSVSLQVLRTIRVVSSPDFGRHTIDLSSLERP